MTSFKAENRWQIVIGIWNLVILPTILIFAPCYLVDDADGRVTATRFCFGVMVLLSPFSALDSAIDFPILFVELILWSAGLFALKRSRRFSGDAILNVWWLARCLWISCALPMTLFFVPFYRVDDLNHRISSVQLSFLFGAGDFSRFSPFATAVDLPVFIFELSWWVVVLFLLHRGWKAERP